MKDPLWEHFESKVDTKGDLYSYCNHCSYRNKNRNNTTLKTHLENHHPVSAAELKDKKKEKQEEQAAEKQKNVLTNYFGASPSASQKRRYYNDSNPKYIEFKKRLTRLAGTTSVTLNVVQSKEFKSLIHYFDPNLPVPSKSTLSRWVIEMSDDFKSWICQKLKEAKRFSLCLDI